LQLTVQKRLSRKFFSFGRLTKKLFWMASCARIGLIAGQNEGNDLLRDDQVDAARRYRITGKWSLVSAIRLACGRILELIGRRDGTVCL
jgi:hypothetical protein